MNAPGIARGIAAPDLEVPALAPGIGAAAEKEVKS